MKIGKIYIILILVSVLSIKSVGAHPFYVSICQVEYNKETKSLEMALKVFADDLLLGLENEGITKLFLGEEKENPKTDEYIFDYLKLQMKFKINQKDAEFSYVGKEMENSVVWIYLEIVNVDDLQTAEVETKLLTEVRETQNNIVQINKNGEIKNMLLNKDKTVDSVQF
ncbi:DUF6702 family protein [uncultured Draconibacterium sp.]|uniref:DUF6702 family protein n=1 Tax=uncultured Draconibacterium sp. TaxID=1573823 RepID=UPI003216936E